MDKGPQELADGDGERPRTVNVRSAMFWMTVGTLFYVAAHWLLTIVVFQMGGAEANGDYTLAMSSSTVAYSVVMFGIRPFQISDTRGAFSDSAYLASRVLTSLLAVITAAVTLPFTADAARLWPLLVAFLAFRLTEGWMDVFHGILQRSDRMDKAGVALMARGLAEVAVFAGVLAMTGSVFWAVTGILVVSLLGLGALEWRWAKPYLDGKPFSSSGGWARAAQLVRLCVPLLAANLAYSAILFLSRNAVGSVWGPATLGYYGAISAPLLLVPLLISSLYTPLMGELAEHHLSGKKRRLVVLVAKLVLVILGLMGITFALLPLVGPPILALIFGPSILDHMDLLLPVAASVSLTALVGFGNAVLTAVRRIRWTMVAAAFAVMIVWVAVHPLVATYGANGASFALIAGQAAQLAVTMVGFGVGLWAKGNVRRLQGE